MKYLALLALLIGAPAFAETIQVFPNECERPDCMNEADIVDRSLFHVQSHADATSGFVDEANYSIVMVVKEALHGKPMGCYHSMYKIVWNYEADNHRGRSLYPPGPAGDQTWAHLSGPWTKVSYTVICENAKNMQLAGECGFGSPSHRDY